MTDEVQPTVTPPETPPPPPPADAVDESGVPWKNRLAELGRKLDEERRLNQQYQQVLGQRQAPAQPPAQPGKKNWEEVFDPTSLAAVREMATEIANQEAKKVAFSMLARARVNQDIGEDPKLRELAQGEYAALTSDPYYSQHATEILEELAVSRARNKLSAQQHQAQTAQNQQAAVQAANQSLLGASTLPGTQRTEPGTGQGKDDYIKKFMADPDQHKFLKSMYQLDPLSPEGQKKLREVAEQGWKGSNISERMAGQMGEVEFLRRGRQ